MSHRKKVSPGRAPTSHGVMETVPKVTPVSTSVSTIKRDSGSTTMVTMTTTMAVTTSASRSDARVTPAKRQLFPEKLAKVPVSSTTPVGKPQRVPKGTLSYCSVAMGATSGHTPGNRSVNGPGGQLVNGPLMSPTAGMTASKSPMGQSQGSQLPPSISDFLSHVGQTLGPSLWQDISHPSNRPPANVSQNHEQSQEALPADPITQPVYINTPGALFTPLNQDPNSTSPPNTTASPVPTTTSSASNSPNISPIGSSLAPGSNVIGSDTGDKPNLRPIGTERACRRATASPLPPMAGIAPLIGGTYQCFFFSVADAEDDKCAV